MQARMNNTAQLIPEALPALQALYASAFTGGVPASTIALIHLRTSQINGCGYCVDSGVKHARKAGESEQRLFAVAAWRDTPYFTDAERAALALTEAVTRIADQADPVPDAIWQEAARHYDERGLGALLVAISTVNVFNRINVATRLVAGTPMPWD